MLEKMLQKLTSDVGALQMAPWQAAPSVPKVAAPRPEVNYQANQQMLDQYVQITRSSPVAAPYMPEEFVSGLAYPQGREPPQYPQREPSQGGGVLYPPAQQQQQLVHQQQVVYVQQPSLVRNFQQAPQGGSLYGQASQGGKGGHLYGQVSQGRLQQQQEDDDCDEFDEPQVRERI